MGLIETYNYYMYEMSDTRTTSWPLINSPLNISWIIIIYLLFVRKIGPAIMQNRKPFDLKQILKGYNIFQILSCCYIVRGLLKYAWLEKYSVIGCHAIDYSDDLEAMELAKLFWWTFMLKICELIETVFFVLRKKYNQISNLHLYHHTSTLLIVWLGTRYLAGGMASFPILLNSCVHILMYSYYLASTFGPKWQKALRPWKPKLTIIQMVQFVILLIFCTYILRPSCNIHKGAAYMFMPNVLLVFYMFYDFYKKSYVKKTKM